MDKSGSIGYNNFKLEKTFVDSLIEYFDVFPAKTRVAVITYSTSRKLEFNFNKYINKDCLRKVIKEIRYEFVFQRYEILDSCREQGKDCSREPGFELESSCIQTNALPISFHFQSYRSVLPC